MRLIVPSSPGWSATARGACATGRPDGWVSAYGDCLKPLACRKTLRRHAPAGMAVRVGFNCRFVGRTQVGGLGSSGNG